MGDPDVVPQPKEQEDTPQDESCNCTGCCAGCHKQDPQPQKKTTAQVMQELLAKKQQATQQQNRKSKGAKGGQSQSGQTQVAGGRRVERRAARGG